MKKIIIVLILIFVSGCNYNKAKHADYVDNMPRKVFPNTSIKESDRLQILNSRSKLIFIQEGNDDHAYGDIYVYDLEHSRLTIVVDNFFDQDEAAWSPNGSKLLFTSNMDNDKYYLENTGGQGYTELFVYDFKTGEITKLSRKYPELEWRNGFSTIEWTTRGIFFTSINSSGSNIIYRMDEKGEGIEKFLEIGKENIINTIIMSPNNEYLAFSYHDSKFDGEGKMGIYSFNNKKLEFMDLPKFGGISDWKADGNTLLISKHGEIIEYNVKEKTTKTIEIPGEGFSEKFRMSDRQYLNDSELVYLHSKPIDPKKKIREQDLSSELKIYNMKDHSMRPIPIGSDRRYGLRLYNK